MTIVTMPRLAALALALALPASAHAAPCAGFTDVDDQSSFCASVEWMKNRGITLGLTPTLYDPDSPVTRLQMAAFMYRLGFQNAFLKGGNAFGATAVLGTTDAHDVEIVANGIRALHVRGVQDGIFPYVNIAAGHPLNAVQLTCATILQCLLADPIRGGTVAGGGHHDPLGSNRVTDSYATVSGGRGNLAGNDNADEGDSALATVGGGENNEASASRATIGGGSSNHAFAALATIGGGELNIAAGRGATVPGGEQNFAVGDWSLAAGFRARADHHGTFVFADAQGLTFPSLAANSFNVRASGGVRFVTGTGPTPWSCVTSSGNSWSCSSDRALKQDLVRLDGEAVLDRLAAMPVYAWHPKGANAHVRHYGPMAQDFHAAFGLGDDDTMIGMQDADGVALAAIQGLNRKLEGEVAALRARNEALEAALRERMRRLEDALSALTNELRASQDVAARR